MTGGNISILNGIKTGKFSIIAANSHFLSDIFPYMIIEENPANKIKQRFPDEIFNSLLQIKRWNYPVE
jgi:acetyltransferase-like isoleucine patch superfamily enzyme